MVITSAAIRILIAIVAKAQPIAKSATLKQYELTVVHFTVFKHGLGASTGTEA